MTKRIIAIWAEDENGLIGVDGRLPWRLPKELNHFKETTMGQALLMGRVTFDGMNRRVLPGRKTIILSKNLDLDSQTITVLNSREAVLDWFNHQDLDLFIIGGSKVFETFQNDFDAIIKTKVHGKFAGDTYFPTIDLSHFKEVSHQEFNKDDKNSHDFTVHVYEKIEESK
ncbi:hypothetical protein HMPREF9318_00271 [Streptococcus urinalis FB127-CNA-2]|uniref:Dihydrofolate reductase n=1 Tax=Streptococcus urinalis 2285-97 TaxID=764291 RepID=G5KFH2_9STRE|nr:dihydrofolate reductase [Streptococcus urinalis]EHJ55933.1 dihydrofolate reductase [Streptococcus urinalis 2285-97]EKS22073.1 hypothetical protein HMPREF9318_00271 [Streptococcus urinalis FB127-CNA-2]VEF31885.1 dihydrofolate reductase [Streptococcus urinalis]